MSELTRSATTSESVPLNLVGSSTFGYYPQISSEVTMNMFTSDGFSVNFSGYEYQVSLKTNGRGIYSSIKAGIMFAVSENTVFRLDEDLNPIALFNISTSSNDVTIDEDILNNIAICDGFHVYIYNYFSNINYIAGTNPYNTGTVSQSGVTVTGVGTTFTNLMIGGTIYFADNTSAMITGFTDATHITVNTSATKSSQSYLITTPLDFIPNYICFHDGRFIATSASSGGRQAGQWRLSQTYLVGSTVYIAFPLSSQTQGGFQTKPDLPIAVTRIPGRQNLILILGSIVGNVWADLGLAKFPYQLNTTFNVDYGTVNSATVATLNNLVVWLGINEKSGIVVNFTTGQDLQRISTDGIDFKLQNIKEPTKAYGFLYQQDGHIFYIFTFYDTQDNLTLMYDFSEGKFYNLSDEHGDFFIAKKVVFFNNKYYFISINDGNIYEINANFTTYKYKNSPANLPHDFTIPRGRVCSTWRSPDDVPVIANDLFFVIEQGIDPNNSGEGNKIQSITLNEPGSDYTTATVLIEGDGLGAYATATILTDVLNLLNDTPFLLLKGGDLILLASNSTSISSITLVNPGVGYTWATVTIIGDGTGAFATAKLAVNEYIPRVDISISYDGGYTWSNFDKMQMTYLGHYKSRFYYNSLGYGNEFTVQFRYYCKSRFVCSNGMMSIYR